MSADEGSMSSTRRSGTQIQHSYQIEEPFLCMTTAMRDLQRMDLDLLEEVEVEASPV
jgi:hypothetical protein